MQLQFPDGIKVADGISADCGSNSDPKGQQLADASREVLYQDDRRSLIDQIKDPGKFCRSRIISATFHELVEENIEKGRPQDPLFWGV
jgi:hypothetical protein